MQNIREHFIDAIASGMAANIAVKDGVAGALFHDEAEFVPFDDLGYNADLGYYRLSKFPQQVSECSNTPLFSVRRIEARDEWESYVLLHSDGHSYILGERWQVADAAAALNAFLAGDDEAALIDPSITADMSMGEAIDYIVARGWPRSRARRTLRAGAEEGRIPGVTKDTNGFHWRFSRFGLDAWLEISKPHTARRAS